MLISLADEPDTSVSILLGETVPEHGLKETDLKSISEKLESINLQFAKRSRMRIRLIRYLLIALCVLITVGFIAFAAMHGEYLDWDYGNPEYAVAGTILHGVEFLFVRLSPLSSLLVLSSGLYSHIKREKSDFLYQGRRRFPGACTSFTAPHKSRYSV